MHAKSSISKHTFKNAHKYLLNLVSCLIVVACGTGPAISTDVNYYCRPEADKVSTYRIEFEDMPEFLKPMLRDEISIVLDTKGFEYTEGDADAVLKMTYFNRTLSGPDEARDEAWETISPGGGVRFIAEVGIELTNTVTREKIWSGAMRRLHNVYEGSYMHDARGRAAMRNAFADLFADCPDPTLEYL